MAKINLVVDQNKKDLKDAYTQAITDLDTIINESSWTNQKVMDGLVKVAQHQKKMLKFMKSKI